MSKEEFINIINKLKETNDIENKINELFRSCSNNCINDFNSYYLSTNESIVIELLEIIFKDTDEWISYWIYELDYGRKWKKNSIIDNGKSIKLKTASDLYDYLQVCLQK